MNCRDAARLSSSSLYYNTILKLIEACRKERYKDKRDVEMLNQINSMLLGSDQLSIPA
jgi:hypothetical protein